MCWKTGLVFVVLTLSQVSGGLLNSGAFAEDAFSEVGPASGRISGGWEAYPGQFPFVASLRLFMLAGSVDNCVGSVVHQHWVLTAASCISRPFAVVVRAGITDLTATPEYIAETRELWLHPSFDVNSLNGFALNNIGLLGLQRPITNSRLLQPIRIQSSADSTVDYGDERVIACGWGRLGSSAAFPEVLNWVYLNALSHQTCRRSYSNINETQICTRGYNDTTQGPCQNDLGGPLVYTGEDGEPILIGVASSLSCTFSNPDVFTRPGPFHDWLTNVTGLDFGNEDGVTETPEPPSTEAPEPPTTEAPEPSTTETPEPPTTEALEPPTSETPEPPSTEALEPPTTETLEPPSTEPESEENDENSNDSDSSESDTDPEIMELLNKLQVKVKVKVKVDNKIKKKVIVK